MNLFEILKQFKNIEPDAAFKETSKRAILALEPKAAGWSAQRTFWKIIETGVAVALTGFFILLITGAFPGSEFSPARYSAIDPQGLRAEAQAIDIQIQLANLSYSEPAAVSTAAVAGTKPGSAITAPTSTLPAANGTEATSSATSSVSIDDALRSLSK